MLSTGLMVLAQTSPVANGFGEAAESDFGYAIALDSAGNIIVVGTTESFGAGLNDSFIAKYSPSKVLLWNVTWGGSGNEQGYGVAVDSADNVIVTGQTNSFGAGGFDAFVAKYSSSGVQFWNRTWGGSNSECGYGVSVDSTNNIIITGYTNSFGAGLDDVFIAKYSASGVQLWNTTWGKMYNERGYSVAVDSIDEIVVTGYTEVSGTSVYDALVVLYSSSGLLEWNVTMGEGNDFGYDIALDSADNIVIAGYRFSFDTSSWDAFVVKCYPSGEQFWNRTWGGGNDDYGYGVALDSAGNIVIAGETNSFGTAGADTFIVNYSSTGILLWNTTWGGSGSDYGYDVTVDSTNHALITGYTDSFSSTSGLYDAFILHVSADPLWQTTWGGLTLDNGQSVAVDSANNIIITGYTDSFGAGNNDAFVVKYSSAGSLLWSKTWGGSGDDRGYGVAVDSANNIIIAGYTPSFGAGLYDAFVVKYSSSGEQLWNNTWGGTSNDYGYDVAVDSADNILITGSTRSFGAGRYNDAIVVKYSPTGEKLWNATWRSAGSDFGYGVIVDSTNSIIVAGKTQPVGAEPNALVVKYSSSGEQLWNNTWGANALSNDVAVDSIDNIFITGQTSSLVGGSNDAFIVKFSPSGEPQWSATWGGSQNDQGWSVAVDATDNIIMTGETYRSTLDGIDAFVVKYSPSGVELWNHKWGGSNVDYGFGVALDSANNLVMVGATESFGAGASDAFIVKYPPSGFQFWHVLWEVTIAGDIDGDGDVDASDLIAFSTAYGSNPPNSDCDFNNDNKVDVCDLFILSRNYGKNV
jgi:uncharacterized delta-60 repeat protein